VDTETNTVHLKNIKVGRDFGTKLEVTEGLEESDSVILNPSDSLAEGARVEVKTQPQSHTP